MDDTLEQAMQDLISCGWVIRDADGNWAEMRDQAGNTVRLEV